MPKMRMSGDWTVRRAMLLTGCIVCACVVVGLWLSPRLLMVTCICIAALIGVIVLFRPLRRPVPLFCLAVMLLSLLRVGLYTGTEVPKVEDVIGTTDNIVAQVVECPSSGRMYTVRLVDSSALPEGTDLLLFCDDTVAPYLHEYVTATVQYHRLYDSQMHHRGDGVYLQAFPTDYGENSVHISEGVNTVSWTQWLRPVRDRLSDTLSATLSGDEGGLLAAMCLGDKSKLSAAVSNAFRGCGLPHLLAVSGLHLTILAGTMEVTLRRLRLRRALIALFTILLIFLYMWLIAFTPSVTRSGIMYILLLIGLMIRRQSDGLNSLGLAMTVIFMTGPQAVYDLGFWFSFGATAGLLCYYTRLRLWLRMPVQRCAPVVMRFLGAIADGVAVTIAATLPLIPVMGILFREVALIAPISNLLTVIPAGWMLVLGFLGMLLQSFGILTAVGELLLIVAGLIAKYIIIVAEFLSSLPGASLLIQYTWQTVWLVVVCVLMGVAIMRWRLSTVRRVWCGCMAVLLLISTVFASLHYGRTTIQVLNNEGCSVVVLQYKGESVALVQELEGVRMARSAFEADGYRSSPLLVVDDGSTSQMELLQDWREAYPETLIYSGGRVSSFSSVSTVSVGDTLQFWDYHFLRLLPDGWWLLEVGANRLLIAPRRRTALPNIPADAYVLLESALPQSMPDTDALVIQIQAQQQTTAIHPGGGYYVDWDEGVRLFTDGIDMQFAS